MAGGVPARMRDPMMFKRRVAAAVVAAMLSAGLLAGCSSGDGDVKCTPSPCAATLDHGARGGDLNVRADKATNDQATIKISKA